MDCLPFFLQISHIRYFFSVLLKEESKIFSLVVVLLMMTLPLLFHKKVDAVVLVDENFVVIHKTHVAVPLLEVVVVGLPPLLLLGLLVLVLDEDVDGFESSDDGVGGGSDSSEDPDSDPSSFPLPVFDFLLLLLPPLLLLQTSTLFTLLPPLLVKLVLFLLPPL